MSLINEALKRAKEAQETPECRPSGSPQLARLQPVHYHPTTGILPPLTLGLVAMLVFLLVWQWIHMHNLRGASSPTRVIASTAKPNPAPPSTPAASLKTIAKPAVTPQPAQLLTVPVPPPNVAKPVANPQIPPPVHAASAPSQIAKTAATPAPVVKEPAAKPIILKLQGIVTHPTRPSAVINGKSVFVGDHIGEFRVSSISSQNVTLVKAGKSTVLSLRE